MLAPLVLLAATYFLAARLGLAFRFQNSQIGVVWPPNAVLLAALVLTSRRRWWVILTVAALAHAAAMYGLVPAWRWTWQIALNSSLAIVAATLLETWVGLPLHFGSIRQVLVFGAIAFAVPGFFAFLTPAFVRAQLNFDRPDTPTLTFLRVALSNSTALLLLAPAFILLARGGARVAGVITRPRAIEILGIMSFLLGLGTLVFGTGPEIAQFPLLLLWVFPPLIWTAVRFGPPGASLALLYIVGVSMWGTARELGPFVLVGDAQRVLSLQLFWIALAGPIMLLAAVMREREESEAALLQQRNQLAHASRITAVGELSGALVHQLSQPLTSILLSAQAGIRLTKGQLVNVEEMHEIFDDIARQGRQAANVIEPLRSLLKGHEMRLEPLAIEPVIRDALSLGRGVIADAGVEVHADIPGELPPVRGDAIQLLQLVLNLIMNGCEAMHAVPRAHRRLGLRVARNDRGELELLVADSGVGLPEGTPDQVFEPFFTTKRKGLGLGLAIGRSIAVAHGGKLWAERNEPRGARFHLVLPTDAAAPPPPPPP